MRKRLISAILMVMMLLSIVSCKGKTETENSSSMSSGVSTVSANDASSNSDDSQGTSITESLPDNPGAHISSEGSNSYTSSKQTSGTGTKSTVSSTSGSKSTVSGSTGTTSIDPASLLHYYFGGNADPNKAKLKVMGDRGFYPMYSIKINVNTTSGNYDFKTLKECKLTETGLWKPAETVTDKEGNVSAGQYFAIRKDGFIACDTSFTAALKWVCQVDGVYNLKISFSGGTSAGAPDKDETKEDGQFIPAADGVFASAYIKGVKVYSVDTYSQANHRAEMTETFKENVSMKKGDTIYFISDPKNNGGWDDPWWYLAVDQVK